MLGEGKQLQKFGRTRIMCKMLRVQWRSYLYAERQVRTHDFDNNNINNNKNHELDPVIDFYCLNWKQNFGVLGFKIINYIVFYRTS